jgi:AraC-like DNA-binding protein
VNPGAVEAADGDVTSLRHRPPDHSFSYQQYPPDPMGRGAIQSIWLASTNAPVEDFLVVPDGCVDVLFSPEGGLQLVGTMTEGLSLSLPAGTDIVAVRLQPGAAAPWLRLNMAELTNGQVPLRDLLGPEASALEDRLGSIQDSPRRAAMLGREVAAAMATCWAAASAPEQALQRALAALARADGDLSIEWLALQCGLSTRQLQRRCLAATGLAPKLLARIFRLMQVLRQRRYAQAHWTHLAAHCGYADQAHFTHDFISLVGCSPSAYARRRGDVRFSQAAETHTA